MTDIKRWLPLIVGTILLLVFTARVVWAQGDYPRATDTYINDYADLLNAEEEANIRSMFSDLKTKHGIEATLVTINSINDYNTGDNSIESFATNLFNTWGIGDRKQNNGVLLLVAVGDRNVRVEVGAGYGTSQDAAMQEVINEHILSSFKAGNFNQGIYNGSRAIVGKLTGEWPPDLSSASSSSESSPSASASSGETTLLSSIANTINDYAIALVAAFLATLGVIGTGIKEYLRYRNRRCPHCQTYMTRLDEVADDVYLDSGQKLEEMLKSIDYDVWKCSNCNHHTLLSYKRWFSGISKCPECSYRTLKVSRHTISAATYSSTGRERVTKNCRHCDYHREDIVTIPRKTRSSSSSSGSSGGSSGGGSSSGGGASGSW